MIHVHVQHPISKKNSVVEKMAEWTDPQICTLIDEHRTRNDEFHNLRRNQKIFWNSIADKINQENGTSFNGHQCKEKFSNLIQDYNVSYHCIENYVPSCMWSLRVQF
jgi:hypothetical protein